MLRRILAALITLALVLACTVVPLHLHMQSQFGPDIDYAGGVKLHSLPDGTLCVAHDCSLIERLALGFYLGEELENHPVFASLPDDSLPSHLVRGYYRVRGRDSIAAIIADPRSGLALILRPVDFSSWCPSSEGSVGTLAHEDIFPAILERIYACTSADSITAIELDTAPVESKRMKITDPAVIGEIWEIMISAAFDCSAEACPDGINTRQLAADTASSGHSSARRIELVLADGTRFVFSFFDPAARVLWFEHGVQALYLTEEQNAQLEKLLGIG